MKYFTLLSFVVLSFLGMAQNYSLTVFNNSGQQFFAILNGIRQNSLPQTNLKISGMAQGSYELKLIFADGKTADINKKFWMDVTGDYLVRVTFKKGKGKLQYFGVTNQGTAAPTGGTGIQYRPNDQSVYSDQQTSSNTNGTQGTMQQNGSGQSTGTTNTSGNGSMNNNSGNYGTNNGSTNTSTNGNTGTTSTSTSNPNMNGTTTNTSTGNSNSSGNINMTTNTTVTDPTTNGGNGNVGMSTNTTVTDPNGGNFGMNVNTTITDPAMNGGNDNVGMNTTISDPTLPTGQAGNPNGNLGVNININMSDPNLNGGAFGTSTTVNGTQTNGSSTTMSGSSQTTSTTTTTNSSGTTTTTSSQSGSWGNSQPTGTTTGTQTTGTVQQGTTSTTSGNVSTTTSGYGCATIMTNVDQEIAKLNKLSFEDDKVAYIQKNLKSTCLSADQAFKLASLLTFEDNRLDISKFFYDRMTDKVNGTKLLDLFTFESNTVEFTDYMSTH